MYVIYYTIIIYSCKDYTDASDNFEIFFKKKYFQTV